jgi:hypothetical protein
MGIRPVKKTRQEIQELEMTLEFIRKFHPKFWDRMGEDDICEMIEICHNLFKARPELLAATNNSGVMPVQ